MIPKNLTHSDFIKAAKDIDKNEIPYHRKSYRYFLVLNDKEYPPKYIITHSYELKNGKELPPSTFNAVEAKNYFINNGYEIRVEESDKVDVADEDEEKYYSEGKEKFRTHRSYERDTRVAKKAKQKTLKETGELKCEVCEFSFSESYGNLGSGYIEAHHKIPVSQLGNSGKTKIEDIALLCSNCHKMIHRTKPMKSVEELKDIVK
jgi:predicted HNH restriction endonuclease